jgi:hypothetical protein
MDCNGDCSGEALIDECGVCIGGATGEVECEEDCMGEWGGTAEEVLYFYDADGDGFGAAVGDTLCVYENTIMDGWVENNDDAEPDCATNDTDSCGI